MITRRSPWALALLIAVPLALAYLIIAPSSADLAAASYRSYLFSHAGLTLWDNAWYGGHHLLGYSLLSPALGAPFGPRLAQALAAVTAAVLFALLIDGRFESRSTHLAACWFALGVSIELCSGRVPFDIGLAIGLGSLVAAQRSRRTVSLALAVLCSAASPVAGAFLALACLAWGLAGSSARQGRLHLRRIYASTASRFIESRGREAAGVSRVFRLSLAICVLLVIGLGALMFPEGGSEPFVASSFWPAEAVVVLISVLLASRQRVLRVGTLLYGAALLGAFLIPTPVGGNAVRLGALLAGPLAVCSLSERHRRLLPALGVALLYWQLVAPVRDLLSAASDPAVNASYYAPLLGRLGALSVLGEEHPSRIEVVPTREHWEARWVAPHVALARGWERQLDRADNSLFYQPGPLSPGRYHAWLAEQAISYVALPDAPLDSSGRAEARLLEAGKLPYLREVWRSAHWRLFAVVGAEPLAQAPAVMSRMSSDSFTLEIPHPGRYEVRVRFSGYWALRSGSGCVGQGPSGFTEINAKSTGEMTVAIDFSLSRVFDHSPRCR
jgi:hypothetical protein